MKSLFLAAALSCAALPAVATTYSVENVVLPPSGLATSFPATTITIDPAAVQRGHFFLSARTGPVSVVGDVADFVSFQSNGIVINRTGNAPYYSLTIDLTFAPDGQVTAARLDYEGISPAIVLNGTGTSLSGLYAPADAPCGWSVDCRVLSAQLLPLPLPSSVPEPGAAATMLVGLAALLASRRKPALLMTV